jgi:hypothetical protein
MISEYCFDLKIPVNHPLQDAGILNQTGNKPEIWFADKTNISQEFLSWIDNLGLVITYPPLIFYTPKGHQCGIHIDGYGAMLDRACMNWCVQGAGSLMHWYKIKDGQDPFETTETQAGTPYVQYRPTQVEHLHSQSVKWPSIVQTGIPHNIHNHTLEPRWVLSCDLSLKEAPTAGLTMKQAQEIFQSWMF